MKLIKGLLFISVMSTFAENAAVAQVATHTAAKSNVQEVKVSGAIEVKRPFAVYLTALGKVNFGTSIEKEAEEADYTLSGYAQEGKVFYLARNIENQRIEALRKKRRQNEDSNEELNGTQEEREWNAHQTERWDGVYKAAARSGKEIREDFEKHLSFGSKAQAGLFLESFSQSASPLKIGFGFGGFYPFEFEICNAHIAYKYSRYWVMLGGGAAVYNIQYENKDEAIKFKATDTNWFIEARVDTDITEHLKIVVALRKYTGLVKFNALLIGASHFVY